VRQTLYTADRNFIELQGVDTSEVTFNYKGLADKAVRAIYHCYEQIVPLNISEKEQRAERLKDFNQFFSGHLGISGSVEIRRTPCYILVRISDVDKVSPKAGTTRRRSDVTVKGKKMYLYENTELMYVLTTIDKSPELKYSFIQNKSVGKPWLLLNETGWDKIDKKINVILPKPSEIKTMSDFRKALQIYDLDIIEADRNLRFGLLSKVDKDTANK
jgi:hypothetical protein